MATDHVFVLGPSAIVFSPFGRIVGVRQSEPAIAVGATLASGPSAGRAISATEIV